MASSKKRAKGVNKPASNAYSCSGGVVFRFEDALADIMPDGSVSYRPGMKRYAAAVSRFLVDNPEYIQDGQYEQIPIDDLKRRYPDFPGEIDPLAGDKTKAFYKWIWQFHPADAEVRYSGRKVNWDDADEF